MRQIPGRDHVALAPLGAKDHQLKSLSCGHFGATKRSPWFVSTIVTPRASSSIEIAKSIIIFYVASALHAGEPGCVDNDPFFLCETEAPDERFG